MTLHTDITDEVPADEIDPAEIERNSIVQRSLEAQFAAASMAQAISASYWLASCNEEQADCMARGRIRDAEKHLREVAKVFGFRLVKLEEPAVDATEAA